MLNFISHDNEHFIHPNYLIMKKVILFIVLLIISYSCSTGPIESGFPVYNLDHFELNGKVQNVHQKLYELQKDGDTYVKGNEDSHELGDHIWLFFNNDGYITKETKISINDSRLSVSTSFLRSESNVIRSTEKRAVVGEKEGAMPTEKINFNYKEDGISFFSQNEDLNGNYGSLWYIWNKGKLQEKKQIRGEDYVINKYNYNYNDKHLLIEYIKEDHDGFGSKIVYERDKNGNIVKETQFLIGEGETDEVYRCAYQYKMDDHNNWIEKTILEEGVPVGVYTREISYFE